MRYLSYIRTLVFWVCFLSLAVLIALYGLEAYTHFKPSQFGILEFAAEASGKFFDRRSAAEWIRDCRAKGQNIFPFFSTPAINDEYIEEAVSKNFKLRPLTEMSSAAFALCKEQGHWVNYKSDEYGFFNPLGLQDQRAIDVALIGDSFTLGYCVEEEKNIAAFFRRQELKTLNFGMAGNGPINELAVFREYVSSVKPKTVFWIFYGGNDWNDLRREYSYDHLKKYVETAGYTQGLKSKQKEIDRFGREFLEGRYQRELPRLGPAVAEVQDEKSSFLEKATAFAKFSRIREIRGRYAASKRSLESERFRALPGVNYIQIFKNILQEVNAFQQSTNGILILVYLPSWGEISSQGQSFLPQGDNEQQRSKAEFMKIAQELSLTTIDITPVMLNANDPLQYFPFKTNGHYTDEGYELVAKTMLEALVPK